MIDFICGTTSVGKSETTKRLINYHYFPSEFLFRLAFFHVPEKLVEDIASTVIDSKESFKAPVFWDARPVAHFYEPLRACTTFRKESIFQEWCYRLEKLFSGNKLVIEGEVLTDAPMFRRLIEDTKYRKWLLIADTDKTWTIYKKRYPERDTYPDKQKLEAMQNFLIQQWSDLWPDNIVTFDELQEKLNV